MIVHIAFVNKADNFYLELNNDNLPFSSFSTEVDVRTDEMVKSQDDGLWDGFQYLGKRTIRAEGRILQQSSAEYMQMRKNILRALRPTPKLGNKVAGTLFIEFEGIGETVTADCSIEGWPEMPMEALSPSGGPFMITWKARDPVLYGQFTNTSTLTLTVAAPGRTYAKTYDRTYPTGALVGSGVAVPNAGNYQAFPKFRLYGPLTTPSLILVAGSVQYTWSLNYTIPAGQYVDVDFRYKTVTGSSGENLYKYTAGSTWWLLAPGDNAVTLQAAGGSGYADISWKNAYML